MGLLTLLLVGTLLAYIVTQYQLSRAREALAAAERDKAELQHALELQTDAAIRLAQARDTYRRSCDGWHRNADLWRGAFVKVLHAVDPKLGEEARNRVAAFEAEAMMARVAAEHGIVIKPEAAER